MSIRDPKKYSKIICRTSLKVLTSPQMPVCQVGHGPALQAMLLSGSSAASQYDLSTLLSPYLHRTARYRQPCPHDAEHYTVYRQSLTHSHSIASNWPAVKRIKRLSEQCLLNVFKFNWRKSVKCFISGLGRLDVSHILHCINSKRSLAKYSCGVSDNVFNIYK